MLHIILMILKIIGILLLVLLALVLFLTAAVLFVPVRYRVYGEKKEDSLFIRAEAFWFIHLLRMKAVYPEPGRTKIKLLCFTLYDSGREKKPEKKKEKSKKDKHKEIKEKLPEKTVKNMPSQTEENEKRTESQEMERRRIESMEAQKRRIERQEAERNILDSIEAKWRRIDSQEAERKAREENQERSLKEKGLLQKEAGKIKSFIQNFVKKIKEFLEKTAEILRKIKNAVKNIWYTITLLCDRIVKIRDHISYYIEVFGEEETKKAFLLCKEELKRIWRNIRSTKCKAELMIGTGEPDTTGYILAMHGILYPIIGNDIVIEPDFENQVLEGKFFLKGRITIFVLLHAVIKIYFDKNLRYFLKRFKREEA